MLTEIFRRFDVDKDGVLNDAELNAYAVACNGKPFDEQTLIDIRDNLPVRMACTCRLSVEWSDAPLWPCR